MGGRLPPAVQLLPAVGQRGQPVGYGPEDPTLSDRELPTTYRVHLDVPTGIVVDITPLDGSGGTSLTNEIHAVDGRLAVGP